jgi:protein KIBRA
MIAAYMKEVKESMVEKADKETNTECAFLPEKGRNRLIAQKPGPSGSTSNSIQKEIEDRIVKRSQTFSPR